MPRDELKASYSLKEANSGLNTGKIQHFVASLRRLFCDGLLPGTDVDTFAFCTRTNLDLDNYKGNWPIQMKYKSGPKISPISVHNVLTSRDYRIVINSSSPSIIIV